MKTNGFKNTVCYNFAKGGRFRLVERKLCLFFFFLNFRGDPVESSFGFASAVRPDSGTEFRNRIKQRPGQTNAREDSPATVSHPRQAHSCTGPFLRAFCTSPPPGAACRPVAVASTVGGHRQQGARTHYAVPGIPRAQVRPSSCRGVNSARRSPIRSDVPPATAASADRSARAFI